MPGPVPVTSRLGSPRSPVGFRRAVGVSYTAGGGFPEGPAVAGWFSQGGWSFVYGGDSYPEGASCTGPYGGGNCFAGLSVAYSNQSSGTGAWQLFASQTLSLYGPTLAINGGDHWDVEFVRV